MIISARPAAAPGAPLPAPTAPPAPSDTFDLSKIDTPTEALLMPGVDLVAGMALGNQQKSGLDTVRLTAGDQTLEYTMKPRGATVDIQGKINAQPFEVVGRPSIQSGRTLFSGSTPAGDFGFSLNAELGGFQVAGKAGAIEFDEQLSLDPMAGFSGHVADINGKIGGEDLAESLQAGDDGTSMHITGNLGARKIDETITQGPNGTVLIKGTIGTLTFEQVVEKKAPGPSN